MKNNRTIFKMSSFAYKIAIFFLSFFLSSHLQPMDFIIAILPVVTKDLPISPRVDLFLYIISRYLLRKGVSFVTRVGAGS